MSIVTDFIQKNETNLNRLVETKPEVGGLVIDALVSIELLIMDENVDLSDIDLSKVNSTDEVAQKLKADQDKEKADTANRVKSLLANKTTAKNKPEPKAAEIQKKSTAEADEDKNKPPVKPPVNLVKPGSNDAAFVDHNDEDIPQKKTSNEEDDLDSINALLTDEDIKILDSLDTGNTIEDLDLDDIDKFLDTL